MGLREEIYEQPTSLARLIDEGSDEIAAIADALRDQPIDHVFLAARGTSDNAGLYAKYLWGATNRLPVSLAAPSLFGMYESPPRLGRALVVGISQSGQSPDIVGVLEEGRKQGVPTLAITNDVASPLAKASDHVIDIRAGEERVVAATKTYTGQLLAVAMLSVALSEREDMQVALRGAPEFVARTLELDGAIVDVARHFRTMEQCVVLGRGYNYATAFEWSLKLKELAYVLASPYSSADFRHGPIAVVEPGFPVLAIAHSGRVCTEVTEVIERVRTELKADTAVISDDPRALAFANQPIRMPTGIPEWLSPIPAMVAAQLFCHELTLTKGYDTDQPRGLTKVTRSR